MQHWHWDFKKLPRWFDWTVKVGNHQRSKNYSLVGWFFSFRAFLLSHATIRLNNSKTREGGTAQSLKEWRSQACTCAKLLQSCPALCDPVDCSLPSFCVHGILQARILEWVALSFSRDHPDPRIEPESLVSPALAGGFVPASVTWEAQHSHLVVQLLSCAWPFATPWTAACQASLSFAIFNIGIGHDKNWLESPRSKMVKYSTSSGLQASLYTHCNILAYAKWYPHRIHDSSEVNHGRPKSGQWAQFLEFSTFFQKSWNDPPT